MVPSYKIRFVGGPWHNRIVGVWAFRSAFFVPENEPANYAAGVMP